MNNPPVPNPAWNERPGLPPPNPPHLGHARALDGIRGIAILLVVAHNFEFGWFQGGFFGVDVFFALSGFLITTLLLEEFLDQGSISLGNFFARRLARLYPALIVLVAASALSSLVRHEVSLTRVAFVVTSALGYFSNWIMIANPDRWVGGLGPTWSLAVEMHFYVLWALTLFWVTRRHGVHFRLLINLSLAVALMSAVWRVAVWSAHDLPGRAYAGTDTRMDAIFLGVAAALIRLRHCSSNPSVFMPRLGSCGVRAVECFLVIAIAWLVFSTPAFAPIAFLGAHGLVGGATAVIILTTLLSEYSIMASALKASLLVWFGRISYSTYLWHVPVRKLVTADRFVRWHPAAWIVDLFCVAASVAIGAISYYVVERPFMRLRRRMRREESSAAAGVALT